MRAGLGFAAMGLLACSPPKGSQEPPAQAQAPAPVRTAKGVGKVTGLLARGGMVKIAHEPMPELGWPAMDMMFRAEPDLLKDVKGGDRVAFEARVQGGKNEVTAIARH